MTDIMEDFCLVTSIFSDLIQLSYVFLSTKWKGVYDCDKIEYGARNQGLSYLYFQIPGAPYRKIERGQLKANITSEGPCHQF